jgi:hypothetical protein
MIAPPPSLSRSPFRPSSKHSVRVSKILLQFLCGLKNFVSLELRKSRVVCGNRRVTALVLLISSRAIYPISCTHFVNGQICLNSHFFFDLSSYLAENAFCSRCKNQSRRDIFDVTILRRETGSSRRETCPGFILSPTILT